MADIQALLEQLQNGDMNASIQAAETLAKMGETRAVTVIQQMLSKSPPHTADLLKALNQLGEREWVIEFTSRILVDPHYPEGDRRLVGQFLEPLEAPATTAALLKQIKARQEAPDDFTFLVLARLKSKPAYEYLVELLREPEPSRRAMAIRVLAETDYKEAVPAIKALLGDKAVAWTVPPQGFAIQVGQVANMALKKLDPKPFWKIW